MMSVLPDSDIVLKKDRGITKEFFWQEMKIRRSFILAKWEELTRSKKGGVGIRDMLMQNKSLMMK